MDVDQQISRGLDEIRATNDIPGQFPDDVIAAAHLAVQRVPGTEHVDRTDQHFVTLDPATSVDLDQAFDIAVDADDIVLHYAIADVGWFVRPGDPLDVEAFRRAVTVYLPDRRATLYPTELSEGAASLLPDVDRPAIVFETRIDPLGAVRLARAERAIVRSKAKLAYDTVTAADLPTGFAELYRRVSAAEARRGAARVDFPEQQLSHDEHGFHLSFRPRNVAEDQNAAMSLATNMAIADVLYSHHTGLFRTMPEVDERQVGRLRNSARALGLSWPPDVTLGEFERSLPRDDPATAAFLLAIRRASGGAAYEPYEDGVVPWHSAMQATYAHSTAPLRRLQDRYVNEAVLALMAGRPVPDDVTAAFDRLPAAMAAGDQRANRAEREALELAEAAVLSGRVGETFEAVVIDETQRGVDVQIMEPAIRITVSAHRVDPGDRITLRLVEVDVAARLVGFERVG